MDKYSMQEEFDYLYTLAERIKPANCYNYANKFSKYFVGTRVWTPIREASCILVTSGRTRKVSDLNNEEIIKTKKVAKKLIDEWYKKEADVK